jgi:hypothetical protein
MALKVTVGLSRKIGLPGYSRLGTLCHVEFEADQHALAGDVARFHEQVRDAYAACAQAVEDELSRQQKATAASTASRANPATPCHDNGSANGNGNGRDAAPVDAVREEGERASAKQLAYARQIAAQIKGFGIRRLEALAARMFEKPLAELSSLDASGLIDTLKQVKEGDIPREAILDGPAT